MTIVAAYSPQNYAGDGSTTIFSTVFVFQLPADVSVHLLTNATQTTVVWVLGTDYTLSGGGSPAAVGAVTAVVPPALGTTLIISRVIPFTQLDHWQQNDAYPANSNRVENALDKITMALQEVTAGPISPSSLAPGTPSFSTFLRGDPLWTNTLIGSLGAAVLAADTTAVFTAQQSANASIRVGAAAGDEASYSFAVGGSANPWEMKWVYDDGLGKLGWQVFGQSIRGTFDNTGLDVSGTVNATLFTGNADASILTTGTVPLARLGTNSPASNLFLSGNNTWSIPAGGGGINTTTTGTFVIAAVNSTQTVPVTDATGIVVGTYLQISDGTHTINGLVTNVASLNLTVKTNAVILGSVGNTMASGAAVQAAIAAGANSILIEDAAVSPTAMTTMILGGQAISNTGVHVDLYTTVLAGGSVDVSGYVTDSINITNLKTPFLNTNDYLAVARNGASHWTEMSTGTTGNVLLATSSTALGFGTIGAASVTDGSLTPVKLNVTNSLTDTQVFSYDSASGHFKMVPNGGSIPGGGTVGKFFRGDNTFTQVLDITSNSNPTGFMLAQGEANNSFGTSFGGTVDGTQTFWTMNKKVTGTWNSTTGVYTNYVVAVNSGVLSVGATWTNPDGTNRESLYTTQMMRTDTGLRSLYGPFSQIFEISAPSSPLALDLINGAYQRISSLGVALTITLADTTPLPTSLRYESELTLELNLSSHDITWPGTITWAKAAAAPTIANGGLDATGINIVRLMRRQGQTQWIGLVENLAATAVYTDAQARSAVLNSTYLLPASDGSITWSIVAGTSASPTVPTSGIKDIHISPPTGGGTGIAPTKLTGTGVGLTTNFLRQDGSWAPPPGGGGGGQAAIQMSLNGSTSGMPVSGAVGGIGLTASTGMTITKSVVGTAVNYTLAASATAGNLPFYYVAAPSGNATTDTSHISTALSTAASAGGGIVVLQAGTYLMNSTILLNDDSVSLIGAGSTRPDGAGNPPTTGTVIRWTGATLTGAMFEGNVPGFPCGCRYEGFTLMGGTVVGSQKQVGMRFGGVRHSSFRDLAFGNFSLVALDLLSASGDPTDVINGPNHITIDNIFIDVGTLYWLANVAAPLSASTAIGFRIEAVASGNGDVFASTFSNMEIVHSYIGVWMGNSDSNAFINLHTIAFPNATGPSTPRTPTVAANPKCGVYITDDSRLNRIFSCSSTLVAENIGGYPTHSAQCSAYDVDFIDAGGIANVLHVGTGCEVLITNGSSLESGTSAGSYYAGPNSGYTGSGGLYSILFNESLGKVSLTNRSGTVTSF